MCVAGSFLDYKTQWLQIMIYFKAVMMQRCDTNAAAVVGGGGQRWTEQTWLNMTPADRLLHQGFPSQFPLVSTHFSPQHHLRDVRCGWRRLKHWRYNNPSPHPSLFSQLCNQSTLCTSHKHFSLSTKLCTLQASRRDPATSDCQTKL